MTNPATAEASVWEATAASQARLVAHGPRPPGDCRNVRRGDSHEDLACSSKGSPHEGHVLEEWKTFGMFFSIVPSPAHAGAQADHQGSLSACVSACASGAPRHKTSPKVGYFKG